MAQDGRVQPREAASQAGRPGGERSAPVGGGLIPSAFFVLHINVKFSAHSCCLNFVEQRDFSEQ